MNSTSQDWSEGKSSDEQADMKEYIHIAGNTWVAVGIPRATNARFALKDAELVESELFP
jgi:hypothetical protein